MNGETQYHRIAEDRALWPANGGYVVQMTQGTFVLEIYE